MRPTNDTEQERRWYTAQNARKRKAALPYVGAALSLPLLLGGAAPKKYYKRLFNQAILDLK